MGAPLDGIRVVDFTVGLAGPWACGILADQGAQVTKIERVKIGGAGRYGGTMSKGVSSVFHLANRGKRSISINLADPEGASIASDICERADVVVQNFRPAVAERLGLGYDDIRRRRDDTIFLSITGLGTSGPDAGVRVYDTVIQARSGMAHVQRTDDDDPDAQPQLIRHAIVDKITALISAQAISAALVARSRGAGGQRIDVSMLEVAVAFMWLDCAGTSTLLDAEPGQHALLAFGLDSYKLKDGWAVVCPVTPDEVLATCRAFGIDLPEALRFDSGTAREHQRNAMVAALLPELREVMAAMTVAEAEARARAEDVPFGIVRPIEDAPDDPQIVAGGLFAETLHPRGGRVREPRHPVRFGGRLAGRLPTSPALGEDTDLVLSELGIDAIDDLRARGVVG